MDVGSIDGLGLPPLCFLYYSPEINFITRTFGLMLPPNLGFSLTVLAQLFCHMMLPVTMHFFWLIMMV